MLIYFYIITSFIVTGTICSVCYRYHQSREEEAFEFFEETEDLMVEYDEENVVL